jgi:hypothetical protein
LCNFVHMGMGWVMDGLWMAQYYLIAVVVAVAN